MEADTAPPPDHDITATRTDDGCYVSAPVLIVEKNDRVKVKKRSFGPGAVVEVVFRNDNPFNDGTRSSDNTFPLNLNEVVRNVSCQDGNGDPVACTYTYDVVVNGTVCSPPSILPEPVTPPKMIIRP